MTLPSPSTRRAAQTASRTMADRDTKLIPDEWYVAAYGREVGRSLLARTILGKKMVLYRTLAGMAVALDDRCAHRSYPLSAGHLADDGIICGYHGFRYDAQGDVVEVPSQPHCPKGLGVRRYTLLERGPLLWIWPGDGEPDLAKLPHPDWLGAPAWTISSGYLHTNSNYVSLHENLLDLTHLSYVHANSFGTPDYARAPYDIEIADGRFAVLRRVVPTSLPPVWGQPTGLMGSPTAARIVRSQFVSPALHVVSATFYESSLPAAERPEFHIHAAHLPTPETQSSTHYFVVTGRDFALADTSVSEFMDDQLFTAFREDVAALELLDPVLAERDDTFFEVSVASDAPAVAMRRYLKTRAEQRV